MALLPGQTAGSQNYTSYSLGINGIMVDISGSPSGITAGDFSFAVGNDNSPDLWATLAATATINVRPGAGVNGSTRVEITFPNDSITDEWLQVTVLADAHTNLAAPDVFYFGNAIGEAGDSAADAKVNATDELDARFGATSSAGITDPVDFNRDGKVDAADVAIARANYTYFLNQLQLIQIPGPVGAANLAAAMPMGPTSPPPAPIPTPAAAPVLPPVPAFSAAKLPAQVPVVAPCPLPLAATGGTFSGISALADSLGPATDGKTGLHLVRATLIKILARPQTRRRH